MVKISVITSIRRWSKTTADSDLADGEEKVVSRILAREQGLVIMLCKGGVDAHWLKVRNGPFGI